MAPPTKPPLGFWGGLAIGCIVWIALSVMIFVLTWPGSAPILATSWCVAFLLLWVCAKMKGY